MRASRPAVGRGAARGMLWGGLIWALGGAWGAAVAKDDSPAPDKSVALQGRELFQREWVPNDPRSHGGDGLGPVFNDSSCVACHNQGGPGGGGPSSKNVDIISAFANRMAVPSGMTAAESNPSGLERAFNFFTGRRQPRATPAPTPRPPDTRPLIEFHAGFRSARSVVLHHFGTDAQYQEWRATALNQNNGFGGSNDELQRIKQQAQFGAAGTAFQAQIGEFAVVHSQRNPTALFGAGLIDAIPDAVLIEASKRTFAEFPEVSGRISRQRDGRIGRFGWKAQTPTLNDFVLTACAVELGLDVPEHPQAGLPQNPKYRAPGQDLTGEECAALTAYIRNLPRPVAMVSKANDEYVGSGRALFEKVGCASCHTAKLGAVEGVYSDLLLHDMGDDLGDTGAYGVFVPNDSEEPPVELPPMAGQTEPTPTKQTVGATRQEWRTPPLWGVRDSGPYLHDGRAETLEQAIALHGGEASQIARRYFALTAQERQKVQAFLKSLSAPVAGDTQLVQADRR